MGPTVWELEGPIPIENMSNTLIKKAALTLFPSYLNLRHVATPAISVRYSLPGFWYTTIKPSLALW